MWMLVMILCCEALTMDLRTLNRKLNVMTLMIWLLGSTFDKTTKQIGEKRGTTNLGKYVLQFRNKLNFKGVRVCTQ